MKCVLAALGQLKRGFVMVALGQMSFEVMGAVEKGVEGGGTGENVYWEHGGSAKGGLRCWLWVKCVLLA